MHNPDWTCPGVDGDGFITFESLKAEVEQHSLIHFLQNYPVPALLVVFRDRDLSEGQSIVDPTDKGVQLMTVTIKSVAILRYLSKVAFIAKRPGNPFAHLISVGRSKSNDITIAVDSVSKVHGYFVVDGNGWSFTDHGSTNGSKLDDQPLEAGKKYPLRDGSQLQLGLEVVLEYLSPKSLYLKAKGS